MKTQTFKTEEEWLEERRGKISGTKAGNLVLKSGKGKKVGYYEVLAERVAIPRDEENVMDRGKRLEEFAIERFAKETGKEVENTKWVVWTSDEHPELTVSPDGDVKGEKSAIEAKCLSSARHCEAYLTGNIPSEYHEQRNQYFIVNEELETLYWLFFDPTMPKDFFYFAINRKDIEKEIEAQIAMEVGVIRDMAEDEKRLTF